MRCEEFRRKNKVFLQISQASKTRSTHQVKSHHQKMMERHKSVEAIINYFTKLENTLGT